MADTGTQPSYVTASGLVSASPLARIRHYLARASPAGVAAERAQRLRHALWCATLAPGALLVVGLVYGIVLGTWFAFASYAAAAMFVGIVGPWIYRSSGSLDGAAHMVLAATTMAFVVTGLYLGGFPWPTLLWLTAGPALGVFVLSTARQVAIWIATSAVLVAMFYLLNATNVLPAATTATAGQQITAGLVSMCALPILLIAVVGPVAEGRRRVSRERDELYLRLEQSERLESLGRLAGEIAHDFRNVLNVIAGSAALMQDHTGAEDPRARDISLMLESSERGRDMTEQLLAFARQNEPPTNAISISERILAIRSLIDRLTGDSIELVVDLDDGGGLVRIEARQLDRVLLNLASNARDAMPDGGTLRLSTAAVRLQGTARDEVPLPAGDYAILEVADTGTGIAPESLPRIFEPFFSTKGGGAGTGLGLSSVYGIVRQAGGDISVFSTPGEGTRLRVFLPLQPGNSAALAEGRVLN